MSNLSEKANGFDLRKQEGKLVWAFLVALTFYALFILFGDFQKIKSVILSFNWWLIPPLLILTLINYLIRGFRFQYYLKQIHIDLPYKKAFMIFLAGLSMTVTPGKTGEVVKAYLLKRSHNVSITHVVPILVFERMTDGIAMILLAMTGLFFVKQSLYFFIFSIIFVLAFIMVIKLKKYFLVVVRLLEKKFPQFKLLNFFEVFFENSDKLLSGKNLFAGIILGMAAWSFEGLSLAILVNQFVSIHPLYNLSVSLFIFSFSSIAGFFVFIPGGLGVAEGSITYFLTNLFPLPLSSAIFITVLFRFITLWFGVGLGLSVLMSYLRRKID